MMVVFKWAHHTVRIRRPKSRAGLRLYKRRHGWSGLEPGHLWRTGLLQILLDDLDDDLEGDPVSEGYNYTP